MISKQDILKIARHVHRRRKGIPDRQLIHPRRDWGLGVIVATGILCGSLFYNGYAFYLRIHSLDEYVQLESSVVTYKQKDAAFVLDTYRERTRRFEEIRAERSVAPLAIPQDVVEAETPDETSSDGGSDAPPLAE